MDSGELRYQLLMNRLILIAFAGLHFMSLQLWGSPPGLEPYIRLSVYGLVALGILCSLPTGFREDPTGYVKREVLNRHE